MAISETVRRAGPYATDGVETEFPFAFKVFSEEDLVVTTAEDDTEETLALTTDYTVDLNADQNASPGGTVVLLEAPDGPTVTITSNMAATQPTTFTSGFFPQVLNNSLDRITIVAQQMLERLNRAITVPVTDTGGFVLPKASERIGRFLAFDANGLPITSSGTGSDAGLRADLLAATGAGLISFTADGGVLQSAQTKLRKFLTVTDYATVQAAVDALGDNGDLFFPDGTYTLTGSVEFVGLDNIRLIGYGAKITATTRFTSYFHFDGCTRVHVEGFEFDQAQPLLATYTSVDYPTIYNCAILCDNFCNGVTVEHCEFSNLYTASIRFFTSSNLDVSKCEFSSPLQGQDQYLSFIEALTVGGSISVHRNRFLGAATTRNDRSPCAVSASGVQGGLDISHNYATHCGRNNTGNHRLAVFDVYADAQNVHVSNNIALNCREQFMRLSTTINAEVIDNTVVMAVEVDTTYSTFTIESGSFTNVSQPVCRRITVRGNCIIDPAARQAYAVGISTYDWGAGAEDIRIINNTIIGQGIAVFVAGPFKNLHIKGNTARDVNALLETRLEVDPTGVLVTTSALGTQANSRYEGLVIDDNVVEVRAGAVSIPVSISMNRASPYTGTVGSIAFRRNRIAGNLPGTAIAVNVLVNASVKQGRFTATDNEISAYATPFQLRSMKRAKIADNYTPGATAFYLTDGAVDLIENESNRRTEAGAMRGRATLVAGTTTVLTTEVLAGDNIALTRVAGGGTRGDLEIATITAGVSFVINAVDSAGAVVADTSTVFWEIVH